MLTHENEIGRPAQAGPEKPLAAGSVEEGERPIGEQGRQANRNGADAKDVGAKNGLTYQWERFASIARELPPLFKRHWREIALNQDKVPLDPDWDSYFSADLVGILHCLTVRSNGILVGYVFLKIGPHQNHASTLGGMYDRFWLDPAYRSGWTGIRMFSLCERAMDEAKVRLRYCSETMHVTDGRLAKVLKRLGYSLLETVHFKFVEV